MDRNQPEDEVDGMHIRIKPHMITLFIVVSLGVEYYYLIDRDEITHSAAVLVALIWGLVAWIRLIRKPNIAFPYTGWMVTFLVLAVLSAFQAYRLYGQGLTGLFSQYFPITWALVYYPLSKFVYYGKITTEDIRKVLKVVGAIQLIVWIGQYILADIVRFTYVGEGLRYGENKFYFSPVLLDLLLFFEFDSFMEDRKKIGSRRKLNSLIYMMAILFEIMVVIKFRLTTAGLLLCLGTGVVLGKGSIKKKTLYILLAVIAGLFLLNTTMVQDILNEVLHGKTYNGRTSTLHIRELGRAFYLDIFFEHPFLGGGYAHTEFAAAAEFSGRTKNLLLVDNGVFGLLFMYGGIGILWMATLWIRMLKYGWTIFKRKGQFAYFLYPLFFLITAIQEVHWYWEFGFMILVLFLVLQQNEFKDCMKAVNADQEENDRRIRTRPLVRNED